MQILILKIEIFLYLGVNFVGNKSALDFAEIELIQNAFVFQLVWIMEVVNIIYFVAGEERSLYLLFIFSRDKSF